jgi:hypothetical protein
MSFQKKFECLHVISFKCKYVLFHLGMLRLFQKINMFFFWVKIKLVSNNNFSFKYSVQGLNPHLLSWFNVYPP